MKTLATALIAAGVLAAATSALACDWVPFEHNRSAVDARRLPDQMLASAAFVEVAVAERRDLLDVDAVVAGKWKADASLFPEPPPMDATARAEMEEKLAWQRYLFTTAGLARVSFRTIERLKGDGPDSFVLTAFSFVDPPADGDPTPGAAARERGDYSNPRKAYYARNWVQADVWGGMGSCDAPLSVIMGQRYLIFRGADGNLLGERAVGPGSRRTSQVDGSVFEPVSERDPWLARVRRAAARAR